MLCQSLFRFFCRCFLNCFWIWIFGTYKVFPIFRSGVQPTLPFCFTRRYVANGILPKRQDRLNEPTNSLHTPLLWNSDVLKNVQRSKFWQEDAYFLDLKLKEVFQNSNFEFWNTSFILLLRQHQMKTRMIFKEHAIWIPLLVTRDYGGLW